MIPSYAHFQLWTPATKDAGSDGAGGVTTSPGRLDILEEHELAGIALDDCVIPPPEETALPPRKCA
jgi:hypothetical protein